MTEKTVYEVKSCNLIFLAEAIRSQSGVSCVHIEAQEESLDTAIALAKKLATERGDTELIEVRQYPGDTCIWSSPNFSPQSLVNL